MMMTSSRSLVMTILIDGVYLFIRKDVLEVKLTKHLESIGYQNNFSFQVNSELISNCHQSQFYFVVKIDLPDPASTWQPQSRFNVKSIYLKIQFQFLDRWSDGPQHNNVPPVSHKYLFMDIIKYFFPCQVVVTFKSKEDRNDLYSACKDGLKKTTLVVTMDSKSRLAGKSRKEISTKLNFGSFLEHYKSYNVAQDLYNKMVRLL